MKHNFSLVSVLFGLVLSCSSYAQVSVIAPPDAEIEHPPLERPFDADIRSLSVRDAGALLKSTEGPAWRILEVQAPFCTNTKNKNCRSLNKQCADSKVFSTKYHVNATCSALYTETTILLTTAPGPHIPARAMTMLDPSAKTTTKQPRAVHKKKPGAAQSHCAK